MNRPLKDTAMCCCVWQYDSELSPNSQVDTLSDVYMRKRVKPAVVMAGTYPLYPLTILRILSFMSSNGMDSTLGFAGPLCSGAEALKSSITFSNLKRK